MRYEIRLKDRTILVLEWAVDAFGEPALRTVALDAGRVGLLPPALTLDQSCGALWRFLRGRVLPRSRAYADRLCATRGLAVGDVRGIIDASLGLTVNDAYWVVPEGFGGLWADYNLYDNDLDDDLALVAYAGRDTSRWGHVGLSPEWTTDGTHPKAWRRVDGVPTLFKTAASVPGGAAIRDHGAWSEYFAAQVADALALPHVGYGLERWQGRLASTCELLNDEDTSLVPFFMASAHTRYPSMLATLAAVGDEWLSFGIDMLVFDAVVCNTDRHAGNYSVLRDNETGRWLGPAPLFDHNMSLFPHGTASDFGRWDTMPDMLVPWGSNLTFDATMAQLCLERHHEWGRTLTGITLRDHPRYPMGQERVAALNVFLRQQGRRLLGKEAHSFEELRGLLSFDLEREESPMLAQPRVSLPNGAFDDLGR